MISVIVPIYNTGKYLAECVESILGQSFSDIEVILVDDGSTDSSGHIADVFAARDSRVRVIHIDNGGQAHARNVGLDLASGDLISFVDSDDVLLPDALEELYRALINFDADISEGSVLIAKKLPGNLRGPEKVKVYDSAEATADVLYQRYLCSSVWGKLYKRSLFEQIRFRDGKYYEDLDIVVRLFLDCSRVVRIFKPVYFYRQIIGSFIHTWNEKRLDVLEVTEGFERLIENRNPELLPAARDRRLSANFNIFALASNHGEREIADACWRVIKEYRRESLLNPRVRFKNKVGVVLSLLGRHALAAIGRIVY